MTTHMPRWFIGFAAVMIAAVWGLGALSEGLDRFISGPTPNPAAEDTDLVTQASAVVTEIDVAPETNRDSYERDAFGTWAAQGDGCNTRAVVLIDQSRTSADVDEDCAITTGEWDSWFDGKVIVDPSDLDIDHLVPLADAWASGAHAWSADQRHQFANDLERPWQLVAVTSSVNRSKGDQDPGDWLPPETSGRCRYVAAWVLTKHHWDLSADPTEYARLVDVLDDCTAALDDTQGGNS